MAIQNIKLTPKLNEFLISEEYINLQKNLKKIDEYFENQIKNKLKEKQMGSKKQKIKELEEQVEIILKNNQELNDIIIANGRQMIENDIEQVISILKKHGSVDLKINESRNNLMGGVMNLRTYTIVLDCHF
jgi:predicted nucleotidyltransferase